MCFSCILFVYFTRVDLCPFSLPWCQEFAAACDCDTPWTFLLFFYYIKVGFERVYTVPLKGQLGA